jgi:hypothetical protein
MVGIEMILTQEAYTSKCSAIDLEPIKKHETYLGKRKKRVLFVISSLNLGGAERQMLLLCQMLETQVDVQIISLELEGPLKKKYSQAFPEIYFLISFYYGL